MKKFSYWLLNQPIWLYMTDSLSMLHQLQRFVFHVFVHKTITDVIPTNCTYSQFYNLPLTYYFLLHLIVAVACVRTHTHTLTHTHTSAV